jgi:hypothetical protein
VEPLVAAEDLRVEHGLLRTQQHPAYDHAARTADAARLWHVRLVAQQRPIWIEKWVRHLLFLSLLPVVPASRLLRVGEIDVVSLLQWSRDSDDVRDAVAEGQRSMVNQLDEH